MQLFDLFYKWVPVWLRLIVLTFLFFTILTANGVFLGNTTDMYSSLGVYAEPYTMASNALYIGMGLGLICTVRFKMRFTNRTLLLYGLICMVVFNAICATTENPSVIIAACFLLGYTKMTALTEVFIIWLVVWSKQLDSSRLYPFVYFMALAGLYFVTWMTTRIAWLYNWQYAYVVILILLLLCIMLVLVVVENHPLKRVVPLYQMDWLGLILLAATMMLINYVAVYGKVEDWFDSIFIRLAMIATCMTGLFFIRRELTIKRPVFNLLLLKRQHFRAALLYFLCLGIFIPSTFQSAFSGSVLRYETLRNTELNLFLIPGILTGAVFSFFWYFKKLKPFPLIVLGFSAFIVYHIIMYNSFGLNFTMENFWLPSIIKGFALVVVYISVGLYATTKMEIGIIFPAAGMVIIVRSFLASGIFSGVYNYFLYTQRVRHLDLLAGVTEQNDLLVKGNFTANALYRNFQDQAILIASKELTGYIIITGIIVLTILVAHALYQKLILAIEA